MTRLCLPPVFTVLALLALASLLTSASATGIRPRRAPSPQAQSAAIRSRQASRSKVELLKQRRSQIARGLLQPRASGITYPTCETPSVAGFARLPGYDYYGYDLYADYAENEQVCTEICANTDGCMGTFWYAGQSIACLLKTTNTVDDALRQNEASASPGAGVNLLGSCASLAPYFPGKFSGCCDTVQAYPVCPVKTLAGYARFADWEYDNYDVYNSSPIEDVTSEVERLELCGSNEDCSGTFYWGPNNWCYLKYFLYNDDHYFDDTEAATEGGSSVNAMGSCLKAAANGVVRPLADCCNTF